MARQLTIAEIASEAGVSMPTVSRVLNKRPDVAPETRQRVLDVLAARGSQEAAREHFPNTGAQNGRPGNLWLA